MSERTDAYAEAFYAAARAEGNLGDVEDEVFRFAQLLEANDDLLEKLGDPHLPVTIRQQIVEDLLANKAQPLTVGLVSLVVGSGRVRELPAIAHSMVSITAAQARKEVAEVRSAIELTEDQKTRLAEALAKATGKPVQLKVIVDSTIRGGVVAQVGDTVIDGSVRRRLDQLRNAL